jgi:hypothetical protein
MLARPSKGQCRVSKNLPPPLLAVKADQNIILPETCLASTISEPEFTVCSLFSEIDFRESDHHFIRVLHDYMIRKIRIFQEMKLLANSWNS